MNNIHRIDIPQNDVPYVPIITADNEFAGHQVTNGEHKDDVFLLSPDESESDQWALPITDGADLEEAYEHMDGVETDVDLQARIRSLSNAMGYDVPNITTDSNGCECGCESSQMTDDSSSFDIDELLESNDNDGEDQTETDGDKYDWENTSVRRRKGSVNPMEM